MWNNVKCTNVCECIVFGNNQLWKYCFYASLCYFLYLCIFFCRPVHVHGVWLGNYLWKKDQNSEREREGETKTKKRSRDFSNQLIRNNWAWFARFIFVRCMINLWMPRGLVSFSRYTFCNLCSRPSRAYINSNHRCASCYCFSDSNWIFNSAAKLSSLEIVCISLV